MSQGFLITLEGGEGAGKSTQIVRLQDALLALGKEVLMLREPGGTAISEQIREVVLSVKNQGLNPNTEALLFQAARAQIYSEVVLPAIEAGKIVLMDRSRDSSVVYQGIVRGFGKKLIEQLNDISTKGTYPDITLLLDVDVQTGLQRREEAGEVNRLDKEDTTFHEKVKEAYVSLAKEDTSGRWVIIDANQSLDDVQKMIWEIVKTKLRL